MTSRLKQALRSRPAGAGIFDGVAVETATLRMTIPRYWRSPAAEEKERRQTRRVTTMARGTTRPNTLR
jgi:hypothetical protein